MDGTADGGWGEIAKHGGGDALIMMDGEVPRNSRQVTIEHMSDCARGHPEAFQVRSHGAIVRWVLYNWKPNGKHD